MEESKKVKREDLANYQTLLKLAKEWAKEEDPDDEYLYDMSNDDLIYEYWNSIYPDDRLDVCKDELNIKVYNGNLQLSDDHVLNDIVMNLDDDKAVDEMIYGEDVTRALEDFELACEELVGEVYTDGRMGRHIVIKPELENVINFDAIQSQYEEAQQDFIDSQIDYYNHPEKFEFGESKKVIETKLEETNEGPYYDMSIKYLDGSNSYSRMSAKGAGKMLEDEISHIASITVNHKKEIVEDIEDEDKEDYFEIYVEDGDNSGIVALEKDGKWHERVIDGDLDKSKFYKTYMSYLNKFDILKWFKSDFDNAYIVDSEKIEETTNSQLEQMRKDLHERERQALKDQGDENWENLIGIAKRLPEDKWKEFEKEEDEISCISMIHSILTYSPRSKWTVEDVMSDYYMEDHIKTLGEERVKELVQQEVDEYIKNAVVEPATYTDSEGVTYNTVTFKKESKEEDEVELDENGYIKLEDPYYITSDEEKEMAYIHSAHPYDDADYSWAKSEIGSPIPKWKVFDPKGKKIAEVDSEEKAVEIMKKIDKDIKPKMMYESKEENDNIKILEDLVDFLDTKEINKSNIEERKEEVEEYLKDKHLGMTQYIPGIYAIAKFENGEKVKLGRLICYSNGKWGFESSTFSIEKKEEKKSLKTEKVSWSYFDKFGEVEDEYLPLEGEGDNFATQIVTAITKLIYKWYNDGDVYDNHYMLPGWANDLSSYANWLAKYVDGAKEILDQIENAYEDTYSDILKELADSYMTKEFLEQASKSEKQGTIYECDGPYNFDEDYWDDEEEDYYQPGGDDDIEEFEESKKLNESEKVEKVDTSIYTHFTDDEYNVLNKITRKTDMDWFSIDTTDDLDFIRDTETGRKLKLKRAFKDLYEGLLPEDLEEYLYKYERKTLYNIFKKILPNEDLKWIKG